MCQMNLDAFQGQMNGYFHTNYHMPILFFTQLMGIAFGKNPEDLGFGSELVSAHAAMKRIGIQTPEPVPAKPVAKKPAGLPMPPPACAPVNKLLVTRRRVNERRREETKERVGVYVCHCGTNIAGVVNVGEVSKWAGDNLADEGVVVARDYKFMCSSLGQELIQKDIKEQKLTACGRGSLLPAPARKDLPHCLQRRGSEPIPVRTGLHPRAGLVGAYR